MQQIEDLEKSSEIQQQQYADLLAKLNLTQVRYSVIPAFHYSRMIAHFWAVFDISYIVYAGIPRSHSRPFERNNRELEASQYFNKRAWFRNCES